VPQKIGVKKKINQGRLISHQKINPHKKIIRRELGEKIKIGGGKIKNRGAGIRKMKSWGVDI